MSAYVSRPDSIETAAIVVCHELFAAQPTGWPRRGTWRSRRSSTTVGLAPAWSFRVTTRAALRGSATSAR